MPDLDRLDRELHSAGGRWRGSQPPAPPVAAVWRPPHRAWSIGGGVAAVAATLVIAVSAGIVGSGHGPPSGATAHASSAAGATHVSVAWDAAQLRAAAIHPGDQVGGTGILMIEGSDAPKLCAGAFDMLMFGVPPKCTAPSVSVGGSLDLATLPGRQVVADTTFSAELRVEGTWTGTSIVASSISAVSTQAYQPALPCPTPEGGWANPASDGAFRSALDPLVQEVSAHPELYAGYYTQPTYGAADSLLDIEVVRTKVDPQTVASRLATLFPYALCVTHDYSQADIDAATFAFAAGPISVPNVAGDTHRLEVAIAAVDDQTLPLFLAHPAAYPKALVTKLGAPEIPLPSHGPTSSVGPFDLPSEVDGRAVLVGDAASAAFQASTDSATLLVGGWLHEGPLSCPIYGEGGPFWICDGIFLWPRPVAGPSSIVLYKGSGDPLAQPGVPAGSTMPVVFQVHTHDPACAPPWTDCLLLPVVDQMVWSGDLGPIPSPTSTQPPNGISGAQARVLAAVAARGRATDVTVLSARSGPYAEVGPPGSMDVDGDRWVWAVVVGGLFQAPDATGVSYGCADASPCSLASRSSLVVLDYVTGAILIQETPAPSR